MAGLPKEKKRPPRRWGDKVTLIVFAHGQISREPFFHPRKNVSRCYPPPNQILRLVINLDRSKERLESVSKQLSAQGLSFQRIPAVDGRKLNPEQLSRLEAPYDAPEKFVFTKALWPNEIGCFLSHVACWEKLVKSNCEWGLIMEDDIVLSPRFKLFATSSDWIPQGVRVIQLHGSRQTFMVGESYQVHDTELLRIIRPTPLCSFAYLIHREAAAYALATYMPIPAPVDDWLFRPYGDFASRFPPHRLFTSCVATLDVPSDIGDRHTRRKLPESIKVHLLRAFKSGGYRLSTMIRKKRTLTLTHD